MKTSSDEILSNLIVVCIFFIVAKWQNFCPSLLLMTAKPCEWVIRLTSIGVLIVVLQMMMIIIVIIVIHNLQTLSLEVFVSQIQISKVEDFFFLSDENFSFWEREEENVIFANFGDFYFLEAKNFTSFFYEWKVYDCGWYNSLDRNGIMSCIWNWFKM